MHAIEVVASGGSLLDPLATERVLREIRRASDRSEANPFSNLTTRERRIMDLIAAGMTNMEIAADISVSEKTVKRSVSAILLKLNLERRGQAAALYTGRRSPD